MDRTSMGRYWTEDSANYGRVIASEFGSFREDAWKGIFSLLLPQAPAPVLDFGCGPGFFTLLLSELGYDALGIDISEGMVREAARNREIRESATSARFVHSDAGLSGFPDNTFSAIVTRNVTWTLPDPEGFYREAKRVLSPSGVLLVFDANWNLPLFDEALSRRCNARHAACIEKFGCDYDGDPISEPLDLRSLPMSSRVRPEWDAAYLDSLGFEDVAASDDITDLVWDEKERLLYGETPLFAIRAVKPRD
ncbi:MAG: class I SAM-dependent methyltransferase [Sutterellaceae bacterium]|nr:class I SAM-dependent methyltransferase [Sutterellaceae bacterium]MDD7441742.1 class I SAM-dependent methyltransferase [Sutterellaceae bacterium]MDY2868691.1 class I SAM-dependent methyltransferase [Mesosutterella sp.]